jgi:hypothetical protein
MLPTYSYSCKSNINLTKEQHNSSVVISAKISKVQVSICSPSPQGTCADNKQYFKHRENLLNMLILALILFALFSSMCEQKVSAYMSSWALLVMTAVW